MTLEELIAQIRASMAPRLTERATHRSTIDQIRTACFEADQRDPSDDEAAQVREALAAIERIDGELAPQQARVVSLEAELEQERVINRLQSEIHPTGQHRQAYDQQHRTGQEERTYRPDQDRTGANFLRDIVSEFRGDFRARERLSRHMDEEIATRGQQAIDRAAGTGAFSGLVVPQYLTDLYAPKARAGRPFADACQHHDLPATGMTVDISQITTGTTADEQTSENSSVSETDADDTLLSISVRTVAGSQTLSRQAVERGTGIDGVVMQDLFRAYATKLDSNLLNRATEGVTSVATTIAYTDASPTAGELYPKLLQAIAAVEAALLDQDPGDTFVTMHSRRWYWLQSQLSSTWPLFGQPGIPAQLGGVNYGERYGSGFRGILPSGTPVVVDNNVGTTFGDEDGGGTEDEIYFAAQSECHLWEDPSAPLLIRAEQPNAKKLGIDLVVYGYYAFTAARLAHAQKLAGTGLVTPTFAAS